MTARAFSPIYALPDIENNPAGVMKIDLIVDPSLPELTIPSTVKVMHIGTLTELIDVEPGVVDVQNLDLELAEDYTTYSMGFWYKVIQGYPTVNVEFRFILEEDGVDTFYFWGKVYREEVEWPEHYINTAETDVIRSVRLRLVSLVHAMKDVPVSDAITEMLTHTTAVECAGPATAAAGIAFMDMLASITYACFGDAFSTDSIQIRGSDFKFEFIGETTITTENTYILTKSGFNSAAPPAWAGRGYVDGELGETDNPHYWGNQFSNCYDLLRAIALNFGWVVRHYYGKTDGTYDTVTPANNLHRLEFLTRGTTFNTLITPEKGIKESTLYSDSVIKQSNIRVSDIHQQNDLCGYSAVYYDQTTGTAWAINGAEWSPVSPDS
jgi:hypothetical protein